MKKSVTLPKRNMNRNEFAALLKERYDYTPPPSHPPEYFKKLYNQNKPIDFVKVSEYRGKKAVYHGEGKFLEVWLFIATNKDKPERLTTKAAFDVLLNKFSDVTVLCRKSGQKAFFSRGKLVKVLHI